MITILLKKDSLFFLLIAVKYGKIKYGKIAVLVADINRQKLKKFILRVII